MGLRIILPGASVRKVGDPQDYTNKKTGKPVHRTELNIEDADGNPHVVTIDHTVTDLPRRLDVVDLECDLSTYVPPGAFRATLNLACIAWYPTNKAQDLPEGLEA